MGYLSEKFTSLLVEIQKRPLRPRPEQNRQDQNNNRGPAGEFFPEVAHFSRSNAACSRFAFERQYMKR